MKKKNLYKSLFVMGSAFTLLFSATSTAYAKGKVPSIFVEALKGTAWQLAKAGSNELMNVSGKTEYSDGWVRKSTGGIKFNSGENGASIQLKVNLGKSNLHLDAFPNIDPLHWNEQLSFILTSPDNKDVVSKTLTHNQHALFDSESPYGEYTARFIDESSLVWNCYLTLTDWDVESRSSLNATYTIDPDTEQVYFIPSAEHLAPADSSETFSSKTLDTNMLLEQFFDNQIDNYVTSLKDYNIGDKVYFSDTIKNVEYDSEEDCTYISFDSSTGVVSWPFDGDLTARFKTNDTLSLTFSVVEDFSDENIVFENLDYFVDGYTALQQDSYLSIDNYLTQVQ